MSKKRLNYIKIIKIKIFNNNNNNNNKNNNWKKSLNQENLRKIKKININ